MEEMCSFCWTGLITSFDWDCSFFSLWLPGVVPPIKVNDPFSLGLPASGAAWPKDQGLCPRCPGVESLREDSSSGPGEFRTGSFHEIFIFIKK